MRTKFWWGSVALLLLVGSGIFFLALRSPATRHSLLSESFWGNFFGGASEKISSPLVEPPQRSASFLSGKNSGFFGDPPEYALGVMIDNTPAARIAQESVVEAPIVFEALAEGGVTRFLAIFSSQQNIPRLGPIRSARSYFFDFFKPFHGIFVHAGGSPEVLAELQTQSAVFNVDAGFFSEQTFWREKSIPQPHNLFTSSSALEAALDDTPNREGFALLEHDPFLRTPILVSPVMPISQITLSFSTKDFQSTWRWNSLKKYFERTQAKAPIFTAQNLLVLVLPSWLISGDEKGRLDFENSGHGNLYLFQNGGLKKGTWQKKARGDSFQFLDVMGTALPLLQGKTWIAIVDAESKITFPSETRAANFSK